MRHSIDIGLYGLSMPLNIDCMHNFGTLFSVASSAKLATYYLAGLPVHHLYEQLICS